MRAQNWVRAKKKKVCAHSLCAQTFFCKSYKGGGACHNFAYHSMLNILSWRPKGRGMAQCPFPPKYQRWSRGHKPRGQGHKKNPRPRTAFPRIEPLEAKDTATQAFSKKKGLQKYFSGDLQFIGVPRIFDWGRPKPQIT